MGEILLAQRVPTEAGAVDDGLGCLVILRETSMGDEQGRCERGAMDA